MEAVQIDDTRLDVECVMLPQNILRAGIDLAAARRATDEAKRRLDLTQAEMRLSVRDNPGKHGLEKVTESAIGEVIASNAEVQQAVKDLNKAREDQEVHAAYLNALEAKKRTLGMLVDLHGMCYFSDVKASKRGMDAMDDAARREVRTKTRMKRRSQSEED